MPAENGRELLTYDEAVAMLPEGDDIHTFRSGPGIMLGADWRRADILDVIRKHGAEKAGPMATSMKHGIVVMEGDAPLFIATA